MAGGIYIVAAKIHIFGGFWWLKPTISVAFQLNRARARCRCRPVWRPGRLWRGPGDPSWGEFLGYKK